MYGRSLQLKQLGAAAKGKGRGQWCTPRTDEITQLRVVVTVARELALPGPLSVCRRLCTDGILSALNVLNTELEISPSLRSSQIHYRIASIYNLLEATLIVCLEANLQLLGTITLFLSRTLLYLALRNDGPAIGARHT